MYFSGLKRAIASIEEKVFYDVSLLFLRSRGYKDLAIVDGKGDGGRDVLCSTPDLRIQLSVQKDWEKKVDSEASKTEGSGKGHFIYVTNRSITPDAEARFFAEKYAFGGRIGVTIFDLNKIATSIAASPYLDEAYSLLGLTRTLPAAPPKAEVALSTVLLLGDDAKTLREETVAVVAKSSLVRRVSTEEAQLLKDVAKELNVPGIEVLTKAAVSKLRTKGEVIGPRNAMKLSDVARNFMSNALNDYEYSRQLDLARIEELIGPSQEVSTRILDIALEIGSVNSTANTGGYLEDQLSDILFNLDASGGLRAKVKDLLPTLSTVRRIEYGSIVAQVFSTNTFDIYRALGQKPTVRALIDSNVAMPLLLGLEFGFIGTRFSQAAKALLEENRRHGLPLLIPSSYLNEVASHAMRALEYEETYAVLPSEARNRLSGSDNAYIGHYSETAAKLRIGFKEFLGHLGVRQGRSVIRVENDMRDLFEQHGVLVLDTQGAADQDLIDHIAQLKRFEYHILRRHDAEVATFLRNDVANGNLFATWDYDMREVVAGQTRILAASPAQLVDILAVTHAHGEDNGRSMRLHTALVHMDEKKTTTLAKKIEKIKSPEHAFQLKQLIEEARDQFGAQWYPEDHEIESMVDAVLA